MLPDAKIASRPGTISPEASRQLRAIVGVRNAQQGIGFAAGVSLSSGDMLNIERTMTRQAA